MRALIAVFLMLTFVSCTTTIKRTGQTAEEIEFADTIIVNDTDINLAKNKLVKMGYLLSKIDKNYIETQYRGQVVSGGSMVYKDKIVIIKTNEGLNIRGMIKQADLQIETQARNWKPGSAYHDTWERMKSLVTEKEDIKFEIRNEFIYIF